jgi:hypothetical protein
MLTPLATSHLLRKDHYLRYDQNVRIVEGWKAYYKGRPVPELPRHDLGISITSCEDLALRRLMGFVGVVNEGGSVLSHS